MIPASAPIAMMARATTTSVHSVFATSWVGSGVDRGGLFGYGFPLGVGESTGDKVCLASAVADVEPPSAGDPA
jgi:hypothetical protein